MKIINLKDISQEYSSHGVITKKVMIKDGELPHLHAFSQATLQSGQIAATHGHDDMYEVFLVEKGRVKIVFDGKNELIAETGACIVTEAHERHEVSNPFPEALELLLSFELKFNFR